MSASSRRVAVALIVPLLGWPLRSQSPADSGTATSSQQPVASRRPARESRADGSAIDAATLVRERGARSLADIFTSRVPGLLVVPGSGVNGMGSRIRLRGVQSLLADRAPLVLVDGVRVEAGEDAFSAGVPLGFPFSSGAPLPPGPLRLDDLDPADVESIEVVAGPASAVYGPGASAGVLLIHTKRGRPGPARWEGYAEGGVNSESARWPANFGGVDLDHPDPRFRSGACRLWAQTQGLCVQDFVQQFNPFEQRSPFRTSLRRQYGLSVSGGSARADYRVAGEFAGDAGPYAASVTSPDPNYQRRLNGRVSGRVRPWSTVEFGLNAARLSRELRLPPDLPRQVEVFGPSDGTGFEWSPLFRLRNTQDLDRWLTSVEARWNPLSWIGVRGLAGWDALHQRDVALFPYSAIDPLRIGSLRQGNGEMRHRTLELVASATLAFSSAVRSTTAVGVQQLHDSAGQEWTVRSDMGTGFGSALASASQSIRQNALGYYVDERLEVGRGLVVGTAVRHDHFKEEKRGATYPSFTASWVAYAGADSARLSRLRLRAAYGSAGPRPFEGAPFIVVPIGTPIPRIEPERTRSAELGVNATLLGGRVEAQLNFYTMRSRVFRVDVSPGFPGIGYSHGTISNRGIEATISGNVLPGPNVGWDVTLSLWGNRNRLAKYEGLPLFWGAGSFFFVQGFVVSSPVGGYWAHRIQSFADANGDGIIAQSELVFGPVPVWAGTPNPTQGALLMSRWTLGSAFRAALTLDYRAGHRLFNQVAYERCLYGTCRGATDARTPLAEQARAVAALSGPTTDYFEDADYLKLRELSLTWNAPPRVAAAVAARSVAVTLAGRNLATWTGYSGVDPEAGSYGILQVGLPRAIADVSTLPVPRAWLLRLDLAY